MHQALVRSLRLIALLSITVILAACCDRQSQDQSKITAATVTPVAPPAPAQAGSYSATLAEGIDFTKPGYPTFIATATGISGYEPWGRWTDGDKVTFRFAQPLPKQFILVLQTNAFGPNLGEAIKVKIGATQQEFKITDQGQTHRLDFTLPESTDTIELFIPKPTSPKDLQSGEDPRKLGLGLIKLQITP
jgi:phosphoglycerol transferase